MFRVTGIADVDDVQQQAGVYQNRRDTLCQGLESMGWAVQKPGARMFAWVPIPEPYCRLGSMKFAIHMMENANVAVAPGIGFGQEGEGYLRLRWWKTNIASAKPYGRCDAPFPHSPMSQIYTTPLTASVRSDRE